MCSFPSKIKNLIFGVIKTNFIMGPPWHLYDGKYILSLHNTQVYMRKQLKNTTERQKMFAPTNKNGPLDKVQVCLVTTDYFKQKDNITLIR